MANLGNFDATQVEPTGSLGPIPADKYVAAIVDSTMKPTRNGAGHYLELTFEVMEGQYKGRRLWSRLNLDNPNPTAVEIARGELSAICRAVGIMQPRDSVELHNFPMAIRVTCRKRDDIGEIVNEIKGYEKKETALGNGRQFAPVAPPSIPAAQATTGAAPWQR